ncbi:MAG: hypothetical protein M1118_12315 [Chloroflexi bacterium]|nr:hypothetical protein [Chloroflexota bacterium]
MDSLKQLAQHAWGHRIISSSLRRNSLLKPFDMILQQLEREPKPEARAWVRAALVEDIFGHLERIAPEGRKPGRTKHDAVTKYVDLFFDGVVDGAHHSDVNRLLARADLLRSAYLFYVRESIGDRVRAGDDALVAEEAFESTPVTPPSE